MLTEGFVVGAFWVGFLFGFVFLVGFFFLPIPILHTHAYFIDMEIWMYKFQGGREHGQSKI